MGLTTNTNPAAIEQDLAALLPRRDWTSFGHRMIYHGRQVCHARKPLCESCGLASECARVGVGSLNPLSHSGARGSQKPLTPQPPLPQRGEGESERIRAPRADPPLRKSL
jgi:adenine-specific DNA glycosylase